MRFTLSHAEQANALGANSLVSHLGIRFSVDEEGRFIGNMPVDARTCQPYGILHGGATAALAESLGSIGSHMLIDASSQAVVGLEVSANHLRMAEGGEVIATGELVHKGRTTHVWDIRVRNAVGELCAVCRLTNLIIAKRK